MRWLEFLNEESRERRHRLRVMTDPQEVREALVQRLRSRFDFPIRSEMACAIEDVHSEFDDAVLDLVPLPMDADTYEMIGPIRARADDRLQPGSTVQAQLLLLPPDDRLIAEAERIQPLVAVTT